MADQPVTLLTICDGALEELFNRELSRIVDDIRDVNTDPKDVREITIKIKIKPGEERNFGAVTCNVRSKLGVTGSVGTIFTFEERGGKSVVLETVSTQKQLFEMSVGGKVDEETGEVTE
jgi:hypothetical protein